MLGESFPPPTLTSIPAITVPSFVVNNDGILKLFDPNSPGVNTSIGSVLIAPSGNGNSSVDVWPVISLRYLSAKGWS